MGTHKLNKYTLPPIAELIQPLYEDNIFELVMTGAEKLVEASPYNIDTLLTRKWSYKQIGYLSATFPMEFLEQQEAGFFQAWVHDWSYIGWSYIGHPNNLVQ